ncbi:hypothetical protein J6590_106204, partial [Homalodisca vitripennis]
YFTSSPSKIDEEQPPRSIDVNVVIGRIPSQFDDVYNLEARDYIGYYIGICGMRITIYDGEMFVGRSLLLAEFHLSSMTCTIWKLVPVIGRIPSQFDDVYNLEARDYIGYYIGICGMRITIYRRRDVCRQVPVIGRIPSQFDDVYNLEARDYIGYYIGICGMRITIQDLPHMRLVYNKSQTSSVPTKKIQWVQVRGPCRPFYCPASSYPLLTKMYIKGNYEH